MYGLNTDYNIGVKEKHPITNLNILIVSNKFRLQM